MTTRALLLLNCTRCDDVVKLVEKVRICECGGARGKASDNGEVEALGSARVLAVGWKAYDGLGDGGQGTICVLPRAQYRARGG